MKKTPSWLLWIVAFVVTSGSAVYQRMTGPTYAVRGNATVGGHDVRFKLPRSYRSEGDARLALTAPERGVSGVLEVRRYRSEDSWTATPLEREGDALVGWIPHQPPAGKVMYRVVLRHDGGHPVSLTAEPVIIRFRASVPAAVLIAHIVIIFAGMLLSTRTGLEACARGRGVRVLTYWTVPMLFVGGLVLGPVVQKYAFDAFWTGWPLGRDLTDNKMAVVLLFWLGALWRGRHPQSRRGWAIVAGLVTLAVWLIPHSLLGSELNHLPGAP